MQPNVQSRVPRHYELPGLEHRMLVVPISRVGLQKHLGGGALLRIILWFPVGMILGTDPRLCHLASFQGNAMKIVENPALQLL